MPTDSESDALLRQTQFIEDRQVRLRDYAVEDYLSLLVFVGLAVCLFLQFFTRYALNDSIAWTEEVARYLLIAVTFLGAAMAMRRGTHIAVTYFQRLVPHAYRRVYTLLIDLGTVAFFGTAAWLTYRMLLVMHRQYMVSVAVPMSLLYGAVLFGLVVTALRAIQQAKHRWKQARPSVRSELP